MIKAVRQLARLLVTGLLLAATPLAISTLTASPAGADPSPTAWAALRDCESGGDYSVVSATGHYFGAYQFDLTTWHAVGGTGLPSQASPAEQDYRALYLYRMRGWQPWTCADSLGLRPDADAASHRVPTYAEAAAMNGPTTPPGTPPAADVPPWPGKVFDYGDCDPALRTWQLRMNSFGFSFEGTGCYYAKTKTAVLALQRANGIKDSGLLGPQTWRAAWQGNAP